MQITDIASALSANDDDIWQFLRMHLGIENSRRPIKCYGIFTEAKNQEFIGSVSYITLGGKSISLPFNEKFSGRLNVWSNPNSVRFGYISFNLKLVKREKRQESGHPFAFTVDPFSIRNVYPEKDSSTKEAELKQAWGVSNNIASGICIQKKGKYYLEDIRNEYGIALTYPDTGECVAPLLVSSHNLKLNCRYYFIWQLSPQIFCSEFNVIINKSKQIIAEDQLKEKKAVQSSAKIEPELYRRILDNWKTKDRLFVGCYDFDQEKQTYCFSDIRSGSFHELKYPNLERKNNAQEEDIIIPLEKPIEGLSLKSYYKIWWKIISDNSDRGYSFAYDSSLPIEPINPTSLINLLKNIWDISDISVSGTMDDAMEMVSSELMSSSNGTFIYELLQNANDYPVEINGGKDIEKVDVEFHITDNYLVFRHSGDYFSAKDIAAICKLGAGTKKRKKNAIGYKGIGFKTVFNGTDYVYVKTGDYSFRFDEKGVKSEFDPWQIMPILTSEKELSTEVNQIISKDQSHFRVQMAIRPKSSSILHLRTAEDKEKSFEYLFKDIFKDVRDIIFIPNVQSVKVFIDGTEIIHRQKDETNGWLLSETYKKEIEKEDQAAIDNETREFGKSRGIPKRYIGFKDTTVLFACKVNNNVLEPVENATVNCYLPSQAKFGFPFLMNTDMVPSGDRNQIKTNVEFNSIFAKIAGHAFAEWLHDLITSGYDAKSVFDLIPDFDTVKEGIGNSYQSLIQNFEDGFFEELESTPLIPTLINGSVEYKKVDEFIHDTTGITRKNVFANDNEFLLATGMSGKLPIPTLRDCKSLQSLISRIQKSKKDKIFDKSKLVELCSRTEFTTWLKISENNRKFLEFLFDSSYLADFKDKPIFIRGNDSTLTTASCLIFDSVELRLDLKCFINPYIPYLDDATRISFDDEKIIKMNAAGYKWIKFDHVGFIKSIAANENCIELLKQKENSIPFYRYIRKNKTTLDLGKCLEYKRLPIITTDGAIGNCKCGKKLYFYDQAGLEYQKKPWIDSSWITFIDKDYILDCPEDSKKLFNELDVVNFSEQSLIKVLLEKDHIPVINGKIVDKQNNLDLFSFLYKNNTKDSYADGSLKELVFITNDSTGNETNGIPSDVPIFLPDETMSHYYSYSWIEKDWMESLSESYYSELGDGTEQGKSKISEFFKDKCYIRKFTVGEFCSAVVSHNLKKILCNIGPVNTSIESDNKSTESILDRKKKNLDFFNFLVNNYSAFFGGNTQPFANKAYPFINSAGDITTGKSSVSCSLYDSTEDALLLPSESWIPPGLVDVISKEYSNPDNTEAVSIVKRGLGVVTFKYVDFLKEIVLSNKSSIVATIKSFDENKAFHSYFCRNANEFADVDLEKLASWPIFVTGAEEAELISDGSGLPVMSKDMQSIVDEGYIEISDIKAIHSDYLNEEDKHGYWSDKLGHKTISFEDIGKILTSVAVQSKLVKKLTDEEDRNANLKFWRLIHSLSYNKEGLKHLIKLPVLAKKVSDEKFSFVAISGDCYISDEYFEGGVGLSSLLTDHAPSAMIISNEYLDSADDETKRNWKVFWEKAGLLSSNRDLILSILPTLGERKDSKTPLLIYENRQIIEEVREEKIEELAQLNVETKSGDFVCVKDVLFLQSGLSEPMAYIKLSDEISDKYTQEQTKYFRRIAEDVESVNYISSNDDWTSRKVKQYIGNQTEEIHNSFIRDLAAYENLAKLSHDIKFEDIRLRAKDGSLKTGSELTLGSAYATEICDFEAYGITSLDYVSDEYLKLEVSKPTLRDFFSKYIKVHRDFKETDIQFMAGNYNFALYIWSQYVRTKYGFDTIESLVEKGKFTGIACIPNDSKVCKASSLYNHELESLCAYIADCESHFPAKSIPYTIKFKSGEEEINPLYNLELCSQLSKNHCYEVLLNSDPSDGCRDVVIAVLVGQKSSVTSADITSYLSNEKALWLNGQNEIVRTNLLYGIGTQTEDNYYRRHFQTDSHIINEIGFGSADYEDVCDVLGVEVLHKKDFKIVKPKVYVDETSEIVETLKQKSILLAAIVNASEHYTWYDSYVLYQNAAEKLKFMRCNDLTIECKVNPEISESDVITCFFDEEEQTFYYVYGWQDKLVFDTLVTKLCAEDVMNIPGNDTETIKKIIDENMVGKRLADFVKRYCTHMSEDLEFRKAFHSCYPSVAEQLGWDNFKEKKKVATGSFREAVAFETEGRDDVIPEKFTEPQIKDAETDVISEEPIISPASKTELSPEAPAALTEQTGKEIPKAEQSFKAGDNNDTIFGNDHVVTIGIPIADNYPEPPLYEDEEEEDKTNHETIQAMESKMDPIEKSDPLASKEHSQTSGKKISNERGSSHPSHVGKSSGRWEKPTQLDSTWVAHGNEIKPIVLGQAEFEDFEYEDVARMLNTDREAIADQNYIARKRFYDSLMESGFNISTDKKDFITSEPGRDILLNDGRYIHRCSAAKGILYISPSIWNKLKDDRCIICVYAGKKANEFKYFRSQEELLTFVQDTAILIQVTGPNKGEIMDRMYSGSLQSRTGDLYAMIPIKPQGAFGMLYTTSAKDLDEATFNLENL